MGWLTFHEAGGFGWAVLAVGIAATLCGVMAIVAAIRRSRAALRLGAAAVAMGALCAAIGSYGMVRGRVDTDRAVVMERPVQKERHRREGWRKAGERAIVGMWFAALPLLAGIAAVIAAPRRRPEDADLPPGVSPPLRIAAPLSVTAAGMLFAAIGVSAAREPLPGRAMAVDDPLWDVLDEAERLRAVRGQDDIVAGCLRFGAALDRAPVARASEAVPDLRALGSGCVHWMLMQARGKPISESLGDLEVLTKSFFVRNDRDEEQAVQTAILSIPAQKEAERPGEVTFGDPAVTGKLDRAKLAESLDGMRPRLGRCYARWDGSYEGEAGEVTVRFGLEGDGRTRGFPEVIGPIEDPGLRQCVRHAFYMSAFPRPETTADVTVAVRFTAKSG